MFRETNRVFSFSLFIDIWKKFELSLKIKAIVWYLYGYTAFNWNATVTGVVNASTYHLVMFFFCRAILWSTNFVFFPISMFLFCRAKNKEPTFYPFGINISFSSFFFWIYVTNLFSYPYRCIYCICISNFYNWKFYFGLRLFEFSSC